MTKEEFCWLVFALCLFSFNSGFYLALWACKKDLDAPSHEE